MKDHPPRLRCWRARSQHRVRPALEEHPDDAAGGDGRAGEGTDARGGEIGRFRRRGQARGELRADLDIDIANDALYYRLLVSGAPLRPRYADALLDQFYDAMSVD